jgi:hypothetical protein
VPLCLNLSSLIANYSCDRRFVLDIASITASEKTAPGKLNESKAANQNQSQAVPAMDNATNQSATSSASFDNNASASNDSARNASANSSSSTPRFKGRPRFLTAFNRLISPMIITQRRVLPADACVLVRDHKLAEAFKGSCRGNAPDLRPFGVDPAFEPSSSIYDGSLDPADYYEKGEFMPGPEGLPPVPYGFFPVRCYIYGEGDGGFRFTLLYSKNK